MLKSIVQRETLPVLRPKGILKSIEDVKVVERQVGRLEETTLRPGTCETFLPAKVTDSFRRIEFKNGNCIHQRGGSLELVTKTGDYLPSATVSEVWSPLNLGLPTSHDQLRIQSTHSEGNRWQRQTQTICRDGQTEVEVRLGQLNVGTYDSARFFITPGGKVENDSGKKCGKLSQDGCRVQVKTENGEGLIVGLVVPHDFYTAK